MSWSSEEYLAHHGIMGQKWGKRNGPPYPLGSEAHSAAEEKAHWRTSLASGSDNGKDYSKKIKKSLNNLDKEQTETIDRIDRLQYKATKQLAKQHEKGSSEVSDETNKIIDEIKRNREYLKESEQLTWKLIGDAANAGYNIESKKIMRDMDKGRAFVTATSVVAGGAVIGIPLSTILNAGRASSAGTTGMVEGNKYKVKKDKNNEGHITLDQTRARGAEQAESYKANKLLNVAKKADATRIKNEQKRVNKEADEYAKKQVSYNMKDRTKDLATIGRSGMIEKSADKAMAQVNAQMDYKLSTLNLPSNVMSKLSGLEAYQKNLYYKAMTARTDEEKDKYLRKFDKTLK